MICETYCVCEAPHNLEASMMFVCTKGHEMSDLFTATRLVFAAMPPYDVSYWPTAFLTTFFGLCLILPQFP